MKHSLSPGRVSRGTFLSLGSPWIADLAARAGFDWVLLDLEHGLYTEATLQASLLALRAVSTLAIVRVPSWKEAHQIARVLDQGADGVMIPQIRTAAQARRAIAAARHLPAGTRGFSRSVPAFGYGLERAERRPVVMLQVETPEAVTAADALAALEGADALFVGPADLRRALEHAPAAFPGYGEILGRIAGAAARHGKQAGILVRDPAELSGLRALGYELLALHSDTGILREGFADALKADIPG